ncbi:MAG: nucleotidyl transferase AbiEii/AbiGii toxin family protein [Rhodobacteraceae bacterium]|nr:nucleotidyl transferase AbiEii/AbiGii toxin family protein [Paracoccaceae bacterium]
MTSDGFIDIIRAPENDRTGLFLATAKRLGAPLVNIEKDFWVCWTLNVLYHRLPAGGPRLLFKGGTSLSKAYGLINRFSEDIDVTVFRDDLGYPEVPEEIASLSNKKRKAMLAAIADSCRTFITGDLLMSVSTILAEDTDGQGRVEIDKTDASGQTLLVWYPRIDAPASGYVQAAVRIESGAKSALDPNQPRMITPYIADEVSSIDLEIPDVTTIDAERTFWDKIVIAHGMKNWFERRGEVRQEGQRISRHYYDLHCLLQTDTGKKAVKDLALGRDCVAHALTFFNRPDFNLASAEPGTFNLLPNGEMKDRLKKDYENTKAMIFGDAPEFEEIISSLSYIEKVLNDS